MKNETEFKKAFKQILLMDENKVELLTSEKLSIELGVSPSIANFAKQAFQVIKENSIKK